MLCPMLCVKKFNSTNTHVVVDGLRSRGPKRLKPHFAMVILSLFKYPTNPL
jgi:hypothetical protein